MATTARVRVRLAAGQPKKPKVSARAHNAILDAAQERVDRLEPRLAAIIEEILRKTGTRAANLFQERATRHLIPDATLVAASANSDVAKTSTMIALKPRPDEAAALAQDGGDPPEILHVTLAYLGETEQPLGEIAEALKPVAATYAPLSGVVGGVGMFHPAGVGIALPDARGLTETRQGVVQALHDAGIDYGRDHGFTPHITINGDGAPPDESIAGQPLHFDSLHIVRGNDEEIELPLVGVRALTAAGPNWSPPFPDELINVDALVQQILDKTEPVRQALIQETMTPALEQAGLSFDVSNPLTAKLFADTGSQVTNIAMTTRANLMDIIGKSYQNGLTIPATSDLIRQGMHAASKARATMIARTEMARAVNGGSLTATQLVSQETGQNYNKVWHTAPGAKYPRHELYIGLDGQTVGMNDVFEVGGDELQYPGDPDGEPGETINCRCALSYEEVPAAAGGLAGIGEGIVQGIGDEVATVLPTIESDLKRLITDETGELKLPKVNIHVPKPDVVTANVEEAAKALGEGKRVELTQASEINTFIDDLGKMAADAHKAGKAAPTLDLGQVSVPGTNLFTQDSLGIPRVDMPQLEGIPIPGSPASSLPTTMFEGQVSQWRDISEQFFQSLKDQGISITTEDVKPESLRATQDQLNGAKVAKMMDDMETGVPIPENIVVSSDNYILDGHHHWAAAVGRDYQTGVDVPHPITVERIDEPITTLLQQARDYSKDMGIPPQSAFDATKTVVTPPVPPSVPPVATNVQSIDIGITPFRAGVDNAVGFYDSAKYQQFINDVNQSAEAYGVHVDSLDKVTGVWEGDTEPSVSIHVSATDPEPDSEVYKGQHSAPGPDYGAPMDDLTGEHNGAQIYPKDVYDPKNQVHLYGQGGGPEDRAMDQATFNTINGVKGDPNAIVTVYRAVPGNVTEINPGDWVTPSKTYAEHHADANLGAGADGHVISMQVPAGQLWTNGDSIQEWGWNPPNFEQFNAAARARAFSANLGRAFNQEGVLLFQPDAKGESIMATFHTATPQAEVTAAMKAAGVSGGRFTADGRLQVIGSGTDFVKQLAKLAKDLGDYDMARGNFTMMERDSGDYKAALDAISHPSGVTAEIAPVPDRPPSVTLTRGSPITGYPRSGFGKDLTAIKKLQLPLQEAAPQQEWISDMTFKPKSLGISVPSSATSPKDVIAEYTQDGSHDINHYLSGRPLPNSELEQYEDGEQVEENALAMEQIVASAPPLPEGTTLYRGINPVGVNPALRDQGNAAAKAILDKLSQKWGLDKLDPYSMEYGNIWRDPKFQKEHTKAVKDAYNAITKVVGDWARQEYPVGSYVAMGEPAEFESMTLNPALAANFGPSAGQPSVVFRVLNAKTGAPIFPFSSFTDESEVLAPPDTMYRVRSVQLAKMDIAGAPPELGKTADKVLVTLEEAPKCGPVAAALTAATGVACTNIAKYVQTGDRPKPTVGNSVLFPGQPRDAAQSAAANRDAAILRYAAENNMSPADYKAAAQEAIRSYVAAHPQIRLRITHQALEQVVQDGRFKNEFELPGVTANMVQGRVEAEQNLFGIKPNADPASRPIYGYLAGTADETAEVQEYGDIIVNLDPSVNSRATFSIGDSYHSSIESDLSPSLLSDPGIGSWDGSFDIVKAFREGNIGEISRYVEVEIHGGLPVADVGGIKPDEALIIAREDAQRTKEAIDAITEIYANNKGTQQASPQVEQSGLPTDKPPQFDYAHALREIGKNAGLRQGALADLIARVGIRGIVAGDFEDFNVLQAIGAGNI